MTTTFSRAGAEASNAGDHFHLLWACRKALTMLSPNNHLTAICIEGPAWEDSITVTDNGSLLSIDLSEYYDGTTYESASMVVFSQLKYSTFHADQVWTVSKLCEANNKARNNSIIRRLADTYTEYAQAHQDAQNKLVLKLASNRKISADLQRTIDAAKVHITENNIKRMCDLRKHLDATTTQGIILESLQNTTNLGSHDFINFLKVINFDDCGCEASGIQRIEILMQLGLLGIRNLRNAYLVLKDVIYGQMLPTTQKYSFTRVNVLASLGMTEDLMFPASSRIDDISDDYVEKKSLRPLVNLIRNQTYSKICIHAGGGIGKTTFVSNLKHYLPKDSIVLVYDCFGGGSFCQPSEQRHLPKVALRQICNELAVACGTGWFLESQADDYEYLRYLKYQLEMAVQYVQKQNPHPYIEEFRITNQSATEWRKRFLSSSHYGRTQNRHGSIPTLETLGKYAEWHAMFYAADELRMSTPAVEDYYTYGEWLDSFYPGCHGFWFSELIGNIPCQPFFWQFKRINHPEDRNAYFIPERLPDSLVTHDDCITLSLDYSATFEQSHQRIRLESAIVIREDFDHFLDELKKPNSTLHRFYRSEFEYEDDKIVVDQTICVTSGRSDYGLDNSDLLAKDITSFSNQVFDLAPILKQQFPEPLQNVATHTDGSREDAHLYRWIEGSHDYLHNEISTYGHMITVKQDRLQVALAPSGCLLVFVVDIKFEDRAYQFHGTHWETAKMKKIYVLQHNGLISSIPL